MLPGLNKQIKMIVGWNGSKYITQLITLSVSDFNQTHTETNTHVNKPTLNSFKQVQNSKEKPSLKAYKCKDFNSCHYPGVHEKNASKKKKLHQGTWLLQKTLINT